MEPTRDANTLQLAKIERQDSAQPGKGQPCTAAKAKAKKAPSNTSALIKPAEAKKAKTETPKMEVPKDEKAIALTESLARKATKDMNTGSAADKEPEGNAKRKGGNETKTKKSEGDKGPQEADKAPGKKTSNDTTKQKQPTLTAQQQNKVDNSDTSDKEHDAEDPQDDEDARMLVRKKKDAHARYMRFSRSLKSF